MTLNEYIQKTIDLIDTNEQDKLDLVFMSCPLNILTQLCETLMDIDVYPSDRVYPYTIVAGYIFANTFAPTLLEIDESKYNARYTFECALFMKSIHDVYTDLQRLLPRHVHSVTGDANVNGVTRIHIDVFIDGGNTI